MNFHLCYVCAGNLEGAPPPEHYREGFHRFCRTIREFAPLIGREEEDTHWRVVLINSNGGLNDDMRRSVGFPFTEVKYDGKGWDIGAQQFCAQRLPLDEWMVCFSSWAYFTFDGWLDRYVTAVETNGDALYGSLTSHEAAPHIRGSGYCLRVESYLQYPHLVNSRDASFKAEFGPDSLTNWFIKNKRGAFLVTREGIYSHDMFRVPDNIFRRGDQSALINRDKHSLIYDQADETERRRLAALSD